MRLIDSIPPATTHSDSPSRMLCAAAAIACIPEAHALLIVCAGVVYGHAGPMADLARGIRTGTRLPRVPHDHFVDFVSRHIARSSAARTATAPSSAG